LAHLSFFLLIPLKASFYILPVESLTVSATNVQSQVAQPEFQLGGQRRESTAGLTLARNAVHDSAIAANIT